MTESIRTHSTHASARVAVVLCLSALLLAMPASPLAAELPDPLVRLTRKSRYFGAYPIAMAVNPDGRRVAVASSRNGLFVFDGEEFTHSERYQTGGSGPSQQNLCHLAFSADGKRLVGVTLSGELITWKAGSPKPVERRKIKGLKHSLRHASLSDDLAVMVASTSNRRSFVVYDLAEDKVLQSESNFHRMTLLSPDGSLYVLTPYKKPVVIRRTDTNAEVASLKEIRSSQTGCFTADNRLLALATHDGLVALIDLKKGKPFRTLSLGCRGVYDMDFSPDGNRLLVARQNKSPRVYDIAAELKAEQPKGRSTDQAVDPAVKPLELDVAGGVPRKVGWSADGQRAVVALARGEFQVFDAVTGKSLLKDTGHRGAVSGVTFLGGRRLVSADVSGRALCWQLPDGKQLQRRTLPDMVLAATAAPDGRRVALGGVGEVFLWRPGSGDPPHGLVSKSPADAQVKDQWHANVRRAFGQSSNYDMAVAWLNSSRLVSWYRQGAVIYDLDANKTTYRTLDPRYNFGGQALSANGRIVAKRVPQGRGRVTLVATESGTFLSGVNPVSEVPNSLALSDDGQWLAIAYNRGGFLRLVDAVTGQVVWKRDAHGQQVRAALLCSNRPLLALGHIDGSIEVVDLVGGKTLLAGQAHRGPVTALAFSPDGSLLAVGSDDTALAVWQLPEPPAPKASEKDLSELWKQLAGHDASARYRAEWALTALGDAAVSFLQEQMAPLAEPELDRVRVWINELNAPRYRVRSEAEEKLRAVGPAAEGAIREALAAGPTPEQQARLEGILKEIRSSQFRREIASRPARAISVLERIATPAARELLKSLAGGYESAPQTLRAQGALDRLPVTEGP